MPIHDSTTLNGRTGIVEGKVVLVIDVPPEMDGIFAEFASLTDVEAQAVLRLIAAILQARETEDPWQ